VGVVPACQQSAGCAGWCNPPAYREPRTCMDQLKGWRTLCSPKIATNEPGSSHRPRPKGNILPQATTARSVSRKSTPTEKTQTCRRISCHVVSQSSLASSRSASSSASEAPFSRFRAIVAVVRASNRRVSRRGPKLEGRLFSVLFLSCCNNCWHAPNHRVHRLVPRPLWYSQTETSRLSVPPRSLPLTLPCGRSSGTP